MEDAGKPSTIGSKEEEEKLRIRPHDAILAKNEPGHARWSHITIKLLFLCPSVRKIICPVLALQN